MADTKTAKCMTCDGRGEIGGFVGSIGSGAECYQTDPCPDCNGSGVEQNADSVRVDAYLADKDEGDLNCLACDGAIERTEAGALACDLCGRKWSAEDVAKRNRI